MKHSKHIFIFFSLISIKTFSQSTFSSLDILFNKTISAVNQKDSAMYISLLHFPSIFNEKKIYTKNDSITLLKPFKEAFSQLISELIAIDNKKEYVVKYDSSEILGLKNIDPKVNEKLFVQVKLSLNVSQKLKMIFFVSTYQGQYFMEKPIMVGFGF